MHQPQLYQVSRVVTDGVSRTSMTPRADPPGINTATHHRRSVGCCPEVECWWPSAPTSPPSNLTRGDTSREWGSSASPAQPGGRWNSPPIPRGNKSRHNDRLVAGRHNLLSKHQQTPPWAHRPERVTSHPSATPPPQGAHHWEPRLRPFPNRHRPVPPWPGLAAHQNEIGEGCTGNQSRRHDRRGRCFN